MVVLQTTHSVCCSPKPGSSAGVPPLPYPENAGPLPPMEGQSRERLPQRQPRQKAAVAARRAAQRPSRRGPNEDRGTQHGTAPGRGAGQPVRPTTTPSLTNLRGETGVAFHWGWGQTQTTSNGNPQPPSVMSRATHRNGNVCPLLGVWSLSRNIM